MSPKLALVQTGVALALLVLFPVFFDPPTTTEWEIAAAIGALVLVAIAVQGVLRFVRSRRPRSYADSMLPPPKPDSERTPVRRPTPKKEA